MDWNKEEYDKISVSLFRIQTYWVHGEAFIITFIINKVRINPSLPKDDVKYLE